MADTAQMLAEANANMFLPGNDTNGLLVYSGTNGNEVEINGTRKSLFDVIFNISVVQPGSVQSSPALGPMVGKIRLRLGEDVEKDQYYDRMYLLPIAVGKYRFSKFVGKYEPGKVSHPVCWSPNGLYPAKSLEITPPSQICATLTMYNGEATLKPVCPDADWSNGKPSCQMSVDVEFLLIDKQVAPVTMTLKGTGMGAWNALKKQRRMAANAAKFRGENIGRYIVELTTVNRGTYVVPQFNFVEAPEELGDLSAYFDLARYYKSLLFSASVESEADDKQEIEEAEIVDSGSFEL